MKKIERMHRYLGHRQRLIAISALLAGSLASMAGQGPASPAPPSPPSPPASAPAPPALPRLAMRRIAAGFPSGSYLGVGVREIDSDRAKELNLADEYGVEVTSLVPDGPAAKSGLQPGDVVLTYNGQRVEGTEQFVRMVQETPPGRHVKIQVNRHGATQTVLLTTGTRRHSEQLFRIPNIEMPEIPLPDVPRALMAWKSGYLGIEAERVDSQLAQFFGVNEGVLVRTVNSGMPAEKAGLRAGDVIIRIGSTAVGSPREITAAVRALPSRREFPIALVRDRKEMTVNVSMDENEDAGTSSGSSSRIRHIVTLFDDGMVEGF